MKKKFIEFSNVEKNLHGRKNKDSIEEILNFCNNQGYIKSVLSNFRAGKQGYNNSKQFLAPFVIEFENLEKWIIFTTTSMRTDRIKGQQWDAFNLKSIDKNIKKAVLVYPDSVSVYDKNEFERQNKKYIDSFEFSAIDAVVSQNELNDLIEKRYIKNISTGRAKDKIGNVFEYKIANILSAESNLLKWKNESSTDVGIHFDMFKTIVECLGLKSELIQKIKATSDKHIIGKLPTRGNPKTDVLVTITYTNGEEEIFTISCKKTTAKEVSVHQYTADAFADVLDKDNDELRYLLNEFQRVGNLRDFGNENKEMLSTALEPLNDKLAQWVLGGIGGQGDPNKHWAQYMLTYNDITDDISIHSIDDYILKLKETNTKGHFNTLFKWTFASGRKGKDIQLKTKIV